MNDTVKKRMKEPRNAAISPSGFYAIVPSDLARDTRLNATAVRLFLILDSRQTSASRVRVSLAVLAADMNTSPRAVQYAVKQLVAAEYLDVQRTGRTNGYRVSNPARVRAVDRTAKELLGTVDAPQPSAPVVAEMGTTVPTATPKQQPPEWFQETPTTVDDGLPAGLLDALSATLKPDRAVAVDFTTVTSRSALKDLVAAGFTAADIAADLNAADLSNARNPGGLLAARLKSLAAPGRKPIVNTQPPKTVLPPAHSALAQWGFRAELAPIAAELEAWTEAGGKIIVTPGDGIELMSSMGDLFFQINSARVGEVTVTDHLSGRPGVDKYRLTGVAEQIGSLRRAVLPVKISKEEAAEIRQAAAEAALAIGTVLDVEGTPADIAAREALADIVIAAETDRSPEIMATYVTAGLTPELSRALADLAEGKRL